MPNKLFYNEHKEECRARNQNYRRTYPEKEKVRQQKYRQELKVEVLTHYGGGKLACVKCGFSDIQALCLDHMNGSGMSFKERRKDSNLAVYRRCKRENFPLGYQTLCANCNLIKEIEEKEGEKSACLTIGNGKLMVG